jgi:hypothetical protein
MPIISASKICGLSANGLDFALCEAQAEESSTVFSSLTQYL